MKHVENSHNKELGSKGEDIACLFLMKHGYHIIERNYWRKWGEIDIVAQKGKRIYFIEVKTVSRESIKQISGSSAYKPEDNVHPRKRQRLARIFQTYLINKHVTDAKWQFDIICVYMCQRERIARVQILKDIII
ncbi:MAG: hypothetical protein A3G52_01085 [Candidatus Taylorbacteria bacterium RIFCSPLOWO2_12_FULL_43_20]|uniref:UPF0102 protein A3G52_01085 n=1 Tax=Candidatus Taylorbacteria bacterium RIFCSPLOWO2_12_FULL_43_20 TaxID=1802332 RepID=A0A1G2P2A6_9BACT|nr:MAG: hypothetical protein A3B98_01000 [Candidatus Taylorbacteria bacterium RIFCSPHIGHO2_02_FULL_43_55]OHA29867.1 MAG: hypothetical protein A3E92_03205 [Candidatus Taylorbacteria bacterium RIFCSPHIGHO2_12_FULL_42_34]OHA31248.1 MAG: hypothetical protein A3B09_02180 [Candidatus Taylorbacteria bacterium RIFCSPLOWO2_01_FULL_43_83]OHA39062.1 MAG: hypothetical protein A3H58_01775 [Candidatus Taylorbacteria bacterium RIFCSPLOWO2_02_FULL_43_22b]OHA42413.1 MAG: hypothetical protein A3G52_01085 [Candid